MAVTVTSDLTTVVRSLATTTKPFGCLPRSKRLAPGQTHTINGDLLSQLQGNRRKLEGLHRALYVDRTLAIVSSPKQHYYDDTNDYTKTLTLAGGSVTVTDPSWGAYSSSIDAGEDGI